MENLYRLVALFDRWSYDHWIDINDGSPEAQSANKEADGYEHILSATFDHTPSADETADALHASESVLANDEGKSELREYVVMDHTAWLAFLGLEEETIFAVEPNTESSTIHYHANLRQAKETACRSKIVFVTSAKDQ